MITEALFATTCIRVAIRSIRRPQPGYGIFRRGGSLGNQKWITLASVRCRALRRARWIDLPPDLETLVRRHEAERREEEMKRVALAD